MSKIMFITKKSSNFAKKYISFKRVVSGVVKKEESKPVPQKPSKPQRRAKSEENNLEKID